MSKLSTCLIVALAATATTAEEIKITKVFGPEFYNAGLRRKNAGSMTNNEGMTNSEARMSSDFVVKGPHRRLTGFDIRHLDFFRH